MRLDIYSLISVCHGGCSLRMCRFFKEGSQLPWRRVIQPLVKRLWWVFPGQWA